MNVIGLKELIREGGLDSKLAGLYGQENVAKQRERYIRACNGFEDLFPEHLHRAVRRSAAIIPIISTAVFLRQQLILT